MSKQTKEETKQEAKLVTVGSGERASTIFVTADDGDLRFPLRVYLSKWGEIKVHVRAFQSTKDSTSPTFSSKGISLSKADCELVIAGLQLALKVWDSPEAQALKDAKR